MRKYGEVVIEKHGNGLHNKVRRILQKNYDKSQLMVASAEAETRIRRALLTVFYTKKEKRDIKNLLKMYEADWLAITVAWHILANENITAKFLSLKDGKVYNAMIDDMYHMAPSWMIKHDQSLQK